MKLIKRLFVGLLLFLLISFSLLIAITIFYGDNICLLIINQINKNIKSEITIEKAKFELLHYFPNATIRLYNTTIKNVKGFNYVPRGVKNPENLIFVKELSINFNLISLLKKTYKINGLIIKNGYINILYNDKDHENFRFWDNNSKGNIDLKIKSIALENVNICLYKNLSLTSTHVDNLQINGQTKRDEFDLKATSTFRNIKYQKDTIEYSLDEKVFLKLSLKGDSSQISVNNWAKIEISGNQLYFNGYYHLNKPNLCEINFKADFIDLTQLPKLENLKFPEDIKINNGKINFLGKVKGDLISQKTIEVNLYSNLSDLDLLYQNHKFEIAAGSINLHKDKSKLQIAINSLNGFYNNSSFSLSTSYDFLSGTFYKLNSTIDLNLNDLNTFEIFKYNKFYNGTAKINVILNTPSRLYDKTNKTVELSNLNINGEVDNLSCNNKYKTLSINNLNSVFDIKNNQITINSLAGNYNNNNLHYIGVIKNFNQLLNDSIKNINITGNLKVNKFDLQKFLNQDSDSSNRQINIITNLNLQSDTFIYDKLLAYNVFGNINSINNYYKFSKIKANVCNGELFNGSLNILKEDNQLKISTTFEVKNIDLPNLFYSFGNFGQSELTSKNIQGRLVAKIIGSFYFDSKGNFIKNQAHTNAIISITDGQLINFKPMFALSKFIEVEELQKINFTKINNTITLNNSLITIPLMEINSSAFNLSLSGIHSLENVYEYHLKLLLSDFLFRKASRNKKRNTEFGVLEKDSLSGTGIYLKLKGIDSNYKYSYDSKQALQSFIEKTKNEKLQLKEIFREEFGLFKKDTSLTKKKVKKINKPEINYSDNPEESQNKQESTKKGKQKSTKHAIDWKDE